MRTLAVTLLAVASLSAYSCRGKSLCASKLNVAKAGIVAIERAAQQFHQANRRHPESIEQLITADSRGEKFLNQEQAPKDPWGHEYILQTEGDKVLIWSYGADRKKGGTGSDSDFNNQMIHRKEI